ncbi:MAG: hypothetical protein GF353_01745 [Candidatus Lokiarchaeota archaeon]|nr:hypothetical protein [Candidatus Lokiarchaeota archaeon]
MIKLNSELLELLPQYVKKLGISREIEGFTKKILVAYLKKANVSGKNPNGVCAGALYLALKLHNKKISQRKIAKAAGVTEVTLRARYKELIEEIDFF